MSFIITSPIKSEPEASNRLFLAGGITNCPDWQSKLIGLLEHEQDLIIYNPRRENFPIHDPNAAQEQIKWEYDRLKAADIISFWFSSGSLNPIVLYELGMWGNSRWDKQIFVGVDDTYQRKSDVVIQTKLARPQVDVVDSLELLAEQIQRYLKQPKPLTTSVPQLPKIPSYEWYIPRPFFTPRPPAHPLYGEAIMCNNCHSFIGWSKNFDNYAGPLTCPVCGVDNGNSVTWSAHG